MVSNRADLNIIKFVDHLITSVVKLVTIKFLDIEVEPPIDCDHPVILTGIRMNFFHRRSFLSDILFSRCSSFLRIYWDKFDFLRNFSGVW